MRIKINKVFNYQISATKVGRFQPGIYTASKDISFDMCAKVLKFGNAELLPDEEPKKAKPEKKAPENKVVQTAENKAEVEVKPLRRRSTRSKPNARGR